MPMSLFRVILSILSTSICWGIGVGGVVSPWEEEEGAARGAAGDCRSARGSPKYPTPGGSTTCEGQDEGCQVE